jgi:hypothetical protein
VFDLGFSAGRISVDDDVIGDDLSAIALAPSLAIHFLKQGNQIPISLAGFAGYERDVFSADILEQNGLDLFSNSFSFGGSIYGTLSMTPRVNLVPIVSLSYITTEATVENNVGSSVSDSDNSIAVSFGLNVGVKDYSGNLFFVTPAVSLDDGDTAFSLSLGYVFLTRKKRIDSRQRQGLQQLKQKEDRAYRETAAEREILGEITKVIGNYAVVKLMSNVEILEGMMLDVYDTDYLLDSNISKACSVNVVKVIKSQVAVKMSPNCQNAILRVGQLVVMSSE